MADLTTSPPAGNAAQPPDLVLDRPERGEAAVLRLTGSWTLSAMRPRLRDLEAALAKHATDASLTWDLRGVDALDTAAALLLWRSWGGTRPATLQINPRHEALFEAWQTQDRTRAAQTPPPATSPWRRFVNRLARPARAAVEPTRALMILLGQLCIDTLDLLRHPGRIPWREISATIQVAGFRALPITGLVGALIGVVIAYQAALQLRNYGAEIFIVEMLGFSVTRELGPMLAAIIVAGRSGSAITAQIGVMRLTQELDAMTTLGMSVSQRLILPRVVALTVVMPLLALWTIAAAMVGGILASQLTVGLGFEYFLVSLPDRMPVANLWIGLGKSLVFGAVIGITATHLGLRVQPNTRDLGARTTRSVVTAITLVIVLNAMFSIVLREVGFS
ncbi:MAG: ABC transporter permease [Gammaproteobacteria bacterium]|nr:ABC transporter permease [Gammaproteobacteria bacterium]